MTEEVIKYRWVALIFLALGLAIVIIDNTVLNVAIPYILKDLKTSYDSIQWVVSGYALIIATLLITVGRVADLVGRKKIFILGAIFFAIGSFIASIAPNAIILFIGEALIEAVGAAMMMTTSLSLLVSEFHGKERAIAFGVWGSVAGASAAIGPLLGGFLTTYYSWRWSLRINVIVALVAIIGSIFIKESKGQSDKKFDWFGTLYSGLGLFSLIFGFIEGRKYGWWKPNELTISDTVQWPFSDISLIPFVFLIAAIFLSLFVANEYFLEKKGGHPLLKLSMFKNRAFSMGLLTLGIISLGQFGIFFIMPIYLQNVLGYDALKTGVAFLASSITIFFVGPLSGILASKFNPKWVVTGGMFMLAIGIYLLTQSISTSATNFSLAPALIIFGVGIGMTSSQLTNIILSSVPPYLAGEASAANSAIRQVGTSIGIAVIGVVLAGTINPNITNRINNDGMIPSSMKSSVIQNIQNISIENNHKIQQSIDNPLTEAISHDVKDAFVTSSQQAMLMALIFVTTGAIVSFLIPSIRLISWQDRNRAQKPEIN